MRKLFLALVALCLLTGPAMAHGHATYHDPRFAVTAVTFRLPVEQQVAAYSTYIQTPLQALPTAAVFRLPADPCLPQVQVQAPAPQTYQVQVQAPAPQSYQVQQVQQVRQVSDPQPVTYQVSDPAVTYRVSNPAPVNNYSVNTTLVTARAGYTYSRGLNLVTVDRFRVGVNNYAVRDSHVVAFDPRVATFERRTEVQQRGLFGVNRTVTETRTVASPGGFRVSVGVTAPVHVLAPRFEQKTTTIQRGPFGGVRSVETKTFRR